MGLSGVQSKNDCQIKWRLFVCINSDMWKAFDKVEIQCQNVYLSVTLYWDGKRKVNYRV